MKKIYVDIETLPAGEPLGVEDVKPPAQMKREETIAKWREEFGSQAVEEEYRSRALNSLRGRIFIIGYKIDDGPTKAIYNEDEGGLIASFVNAVRPKNNGLVEWVGHNALNFDALWLFRKAVKHNNRWLRDNINMNPWRGNVHDTMLIFNGGNPREKYVKLDDLAKFLELPTKTEGMDGSQVFDYWRDGRFEELCEYCVQDVQCMYNVYQRLKA